MNEVDGVIYVVNGCDLMILKKEKIDLIVIGCKEEDDYVSGKNQIFYLFF